ncbi:MAG: TatD family hydrolase [Planctomycetota bacterium]
MSAAGGDAGARVFDTHCHLGLDDDGDPRAEHARARAASVTDLVLVGIDLASSARARDLARTLPGARWSAGLHPNDAGRFDAEWDAIAALCGEADCRAVGETGLDYYRDRASAQDQERSLAAHLDLARRRDLPVILHCRDAMAALLELLAARAPVRGVMHCFSGDAADAARAVALGLHVSFAGPLTYKKNDALRQAAAAVPEDRLLVETDAPFLPPQSRRGKRNEPAFLVETLATLAAVRGWDLTRAAAVTHRNAVALFG